MSLPAFRIASLRTSPGWAQVSRGLAEQLRGRVIALPRYLPPPECEDVVDALAVLLGWPVVVSEAERVQPQQKSAVVVVLGLVRERPAPGGRAVIVCQLERADPQRLGLPHELLVLRDALIECLGRGPLTSALRAALRWVASVADTPRVAACFLSGVLEHAAMEPEASEAAHYCAGLALAAADLLDSVSDATAQWVALIACGAAMPERLVQGTGQVTYREIALSAAFAGALIHEHTKEHFTWRRPLDALSKLPAAPAGVTRSLAIKSLARCVEEDVEAALRALLATFSTSRLGLAAPPLSQALIGRQGELERIVEMLAPQPLADPLPAVILTGLRGAGKAQFAVAAAGLLADHRETVWLSFDNGPQLGLWSIACALGIETNTPDASSEDLNGVPMWAHRVRAALGEGDFLLVIEESDRLSLEQLGAWLPTGRGRCALLILRRERPFLWTTPFSEVTVALGPLDLRSARQILRNRAPWEVKGLIDAGGADKLLYLLGGYPLGITLAARLLDGMTLEDLELAIYGVQFNSQAREEATDAVWAVVDLTLRALSETDRELLRVLSANVSLGWSLPLAKAFEAYLGDQGGLDRLAARDLLSVTQERIRVHELVARLARGADSATHNRTSLVLVSLFLDLWASAASQHREDQLRLLYLDLLTISRRFLSFGPQSPEILTQVSALVDLLVSYASGLKARSLQSAWVLMEEWEQESRAEELRAELNALTNPSSEPDTGM